MVRTRKSFGVSIARNLGISPGSVQRRRTTLVKKIRPCLAVMSTMSQPSFEVGRIFENQD
jgi:FixJ family two-component response regulator